MVPSRWVVLDEVPLGPTGKADRAALLAALGSPPGEPVGEPAGDVLERAWQEVLGVSGTPADANFLDLGGNSILAMQVVSRVRSGLGIVLEPADVLLAESFGELATRVRELHRP